MRSIEELPDSKLAVLFYKTEDGHAEGSTIVVVGGWIKIEDDRSWFATLPYHRLMDERNLWDEKPIGWCEYESGNR